MTPAGHLSVSYISGRLLNRAYLLPVIIGGLLPDIDFFFIFFKWFNQVHRIITHNLLFIIFVALIGSLFVRKDRVTVALSLLLGGFLHLLIDSCMDNNPSNGIGIALLWPFYGELFSPFNVFHDARINFGWDEPVRMFKAILPLMIYEAFLYIIAIALFLKRKER
jgi:membrane-bound metal-dependent hydrolase YbcI (DUF457 family)